MFGHMKIDTYEVKINKNSIGDYFFVFRDMTVYSKKENKLIVIKKGEIVRYKECLSNKELIKIKYNDKKYIVSVEELYHCAINSDANQYCDFFEINHIENIFKFSKILANLVNGSLLCSFGFCIASNIRFW